MKLFITKATKDYAMIRALMMNDGGEIGEIAQVIRPGMEVFGYTFDQLVAMGPGLAIDTDNDSKN